jgi:putative addiction module component (TIGR02574 family)
MERLDAQVVSSRLLDLAGLEIENSGMKTHLKSILALTVPERLQLVEDIWDSIAETPDSVPVTRAQRRELDRRRRAHERNPSAVRSWKAIRARLARRR